MSQITKDVRLQLIDAAEVPPARTNVSVWPEILERIPEGRAAVFDIKVANSVRGFISTKKKDGQYSNFSVIQRKEKMYIVRNAPTKPSKK